jgi:hypothetical protein
MDSDHGFIVHLASSSTGIWLGQHAGASASVSMPIGTSLTPAPQPEVTHNPQSQGEGCQNRVPVGFENLIPGSRLAWSDVGPVRR